MSKIGLLIYLLIISTTVFGQEKFHEYEKLVEIRKPVGLKFGLPSEILFDPDSSFMLIAYDYKPTYIEIFRCKNWSKIGRFEIKGFTNFGISYFDLASNTFFIGRNKPFVNRYHTINLKSLQVAKVKGCKQTPRGCNYGETTVQKQEINDEGQTLTLKDKYVIEYLYDVDKISIYVKR